MTWKPVDTNYSKIVFPILFLFSVASRIPCNCVCPSGFYFNGEIGKRLLGGSVDKKSLDLDTNPLNPSQKNKIK